MITIQLLIFHLDNLVGSTNGLDPTDLKSGRVRSGPPVEMDASGGHHWRQNPAYFNAL